jgi:hypothetical protein
MSEGPMNETGAADGAPPMDPLGVSAAALTGALGVAVAGHGAPPTAFRFQQPVRLAEGLVRRSVLDLAARRFRATLWAGDHRCIDHLDLDDVCAITCDAQAGRLILDSTTARLVLNRHGTLTLVPRADGDARGKRRCAPADRRVLGATP